MDDAEHPKRQLHENIQQAASDPRFAGPAADGLVTRWVLVCEMATQNHAMAMLVCTSSASGDDLMTWDAAGLLAKALMGQLTED